MDLELGFLQSGFHFGGNVSFNLLPLIAALAIYLENSSGDIAQMAANFGDEFQQVMATRAGNIDVILSWLATFVMFAIPATVVLALVFAPEPKQEEVAGERTTFIASLKIIRRNGPYLRIIFTYVVTTFGIALVAAGRPGVAAAPPASISETLVSKSLHPRRSLHSHRPANHRSLLTHRSLGV